MSGKHSIVWGGGPFAPEPFPFRRAMPIPPLHHIRSATIAIQFRELEFKCHNATELYRFV